MRPATKLRPVAPPKLRPLERGGRKSDYEGGFANADVAVAWSCCPGRATKKWEPFCEALLTVYRDIGRQRLQQWLVHLSAGENYAALSNDELGLIWRRSEGFVRQHKRRPFEANMRALHELDPAGFWLLISELDFRQRIAAERRDPRR